jgi:phosphoribosylanthranilate isomerase
LPPFVTRVGVFVNATPADVQAVVAHAGLDVVQLHGDEPAEAFAQVGARVIKVVTLDDEEDVDRAAGLSPAVWPLVDATDPARRGGTGRAADWGRAARLARRRPILLAGGLTADNVGDAVRAVRPWAVDVSSGVESAPGVKSADRLRAFFAAIAAVSEDV